MPESECFQLVFKYWSYSMTSRKKKHKHCSRFSIASPWKRSRLNKVYFTSVLVFMQVMTIVMLLSTDSDSVQSHVLLFLFIQTLQNVGFFFLHRSSLQRWELVFVLPCPLLIFHQYERCVSRWLLNAWNDNLVSILMQWS